MSASAHRELRHCLNTRGVGVRQRTNDILFPSLLARALLHDILGPDHARRNVAHTGIILGNDGGADQVFGIVSAAAGAAGAAAGVVCGLDDIGKRGSRRGQYGRLDLLLISAILGRATRVVVVAVVVRMMVVFVARQ